MPIYIDGNERVHELTETLQFLRAVLADVEDLSRGKLPDPATLRDAPLLEDWHLERRASLCLAGRFLGHPVIEDGRPGITSELWIHAPHHGFARTLSRRYRLGRPAVSRGTGQ